MNRSLPDNSPRRPFAYLDEVDCRPPSYGWLIWRAAAIAVAVLGFWLVVAA